MSAGIRRRDIAGVKQCSSVILVQQAGKLGFSIGSLALHSGITSSTPAVLVEPDIELVASYFFRVG
jgi:hypothetical protein